MHVTCIITCAISHFNPHIDGLGDSTRAVCDLVLFLLWVQKLGLKW